MNPILQADNITAGYGAATVLRDVSVSVDPGEVVVVLGANGAGKSTLLSVLSGQLPYTGTMSVDGRELKGAHPAAMLKNGVSLVPQGRGTLTAMSVMDNLLVGAVTRRDRKAVAEDVDQWLTVFPRLRERADQIAGTLSGGEQQMLAIARALMSRPKLLLCDEISLGLAPRVVQDLFETMGQINRDAGTALLFVEQNAQLALDIASRVYLLEVGSVTSSGTAEEFRNDNSIRAAYLGY
jgi:branched-chain amino acid transport system ATP-binding protein